MTPREAAEYLSRKLDGKISRTMVVGWILGGEIRATNLGASGGIKPRYAITRKSADEFIEQRTARQVQSEEERQLQRARRARGVILDPAVAF